MEIKNVKELPQYKAVLLITEELIKKGLPRKAAQKIALNINLDLRNLKPSDRDDFFEKELLVFTDNIYLIYSAFLEDFSSPFESFLTYVSKEVNLSIKVI